VTAAKTQRTFGNFAFSGLVLTHVDSMTVHVAMWMKCGCVRDVYR